MAKVDLKGKNMTGSNEAAESHDSPRETSQRAAARFVYPGGSKPLDGYTIKRGVGHGGFGEIYYAVSDAGKEVALKLIRRNLDVELRGVRHCLNLTHPNLLDLYDIRQDDKGDTWVIMSYVAGQSLEGAVDANPNGMPIDQVIAWFHGTAQGVAYLHDRGIVHRDLKPGNIFSDQGSVKVGDYGLSKFVSCSRRSGHTESVGTVHYMAPEVANGRYGKEIDIYALGIVLYEMLTGRVPFDGESTGEVLMKHLTAKPDVSMLADPYRSVVAMALEKDPAKRFESVGAMLAAIPQPKEEAPGSGRLPHGTYTADKPFDDEPLHDEPPGVDNSADNGAEPVHAEVVDDEPILRAARQNWYKARAEWDKADMPTAVKIIILLAVAFVLLSQAPIVIFLAILLGVFYGGYRVIRTIVLSQESAHNRPIHANRPSPQAAAPPAENTVRQPEKPPRGQPVPLRNRKQQLREKAIACLLIKSPRERFTELLGSMLGATLVSIAMCVVMALLSGLLNFTYQGPEQFAWLLLVSITGSWAVLIPSKTWEGTHGEAILRRFALMVVGLGLGVVAFAIAGGLLVGLPHGSGLMDSPSYRMPNNFYDAGRPLVLAYMAAFGTLFLLIRWWRQADPLRRSRLSLWSLFVSVTVAIVVAAVWHFPQTWLAMAAGSISISVQLASPWIPLHKRKHDK